MTRTQLMIAAAGGSAMLLAGAYVFQALGYAPCQMCLWQRWPHMAAIVIGVLAFMKPSRLLMIFGAVAAAVTSGIGAYHAGVELKWWAGPASCTGAGGGLGDLTSLLDINSAPALVMCDQVAWSLAGISMAGWNAILSLILVFLWLKAARKAQ